MFKCKCGNGEFNVDSKWEAYATITVDGNGDIVHESTEECSGWEFQSDYVCTSCGKTYETLQ